MAVKVLDSNRRITTIEDGFNLLLERTAKHSTHLEKTIQTESAMQADVSKLLTCFGQAKGEDALDGDGSPSHDSDQACTFQSQVASLFKVAGSLAGHIDTMERQERLIKEQSDQIAEQAAVIEKQKTEIEELTEAHGKLEDHSFELFKIIKAHDDVDKAGMTEIRKLEAQWEELKGVIAKF